MVPPTQASLAWSTASPGTTPIDTELAAAPEKTYMPTRVACPTWLSQNPDAMPISLGPDPLPPPTTSQAIQATQNQILTLVESTCMTMRWRDTTLSILRTTQAQLISQLIMAMTCTVTMVTTKLMECHSTHMPRCGRQGAAKCPAATSRSARICRRLWWQNT